MSDFGFLRARRREQPQAASRPASNGSSASPVADFLTGRAARPGRDAAPAQSPVADRPAAQSNPLDLSRPETPAPAPSPPQPQASSAGRNPLDLSGSDPTPAPGRSQGSSGGGGNPLDLGGSDPTPPSRPSAPRSNPLDLGGSEQRVEQRVEPPSRSAPVPTSNNLLDLSGPSGSAPVQASTGRFAPLVNHELGLPTLDEGERRILTVEDPVVHLTRMQSSAGALEFTVATAQPNQLLLGCLFETVDQRESIVLPGMRPQGPDPHSPIFRSTTQGVTINLRGIKRAARFFVIGLPQTSDRSMPGGTLVVQTYGGSRLEVVLDRSATFGAKALITGYVVEGRIVLRAEHDPFSGTLQQVAGVYGYDQMTWRDPFTPLF